MRRALLACLLAAGCGLGPEDNFTRGLEPESCNDTYAVCQTAAGCIMTPGKYLEGAFPGARQFIVPAPADSVISVDIFFRTQVAFGLDTEVLWYEPGCFDAYQYRSNGRDIFLEAGNDRILTVSQQVFLEGDHLVEVFSDAVAEYLLRIRID